MDNNNPEAIVHTPLMEKHSPHERMREEDEDGNPTVVSTRKNSKKPTPSSPSIKPASPQTYPEPYSVPPPNTTTNQPLDKEQQPPTEQQHPQRLFPAPTDNTLWHRILYPTGVTPRHRKYEHWVGRVGFGAKGLVYSFVGGMTCSSAIRLTEQTSNSSPQGAFILIGDFPGGAGLLIVMLLALLCYVAWRWWEFFTFQGADATFSPFKNFFAYRLSPLISGCVYVAYGYYIIEVLENKDEPTCYPECWRHSVIGKIGLVLFGIAFAIACLTQLLNTFTKKWHPEIDWHKCRTKFEKYLLLGFGHAGFLGRSGLFLFVSILMFRALRGSVRQGGNTLANGINQFIGTGAGRVFMFIVGFLTLMYGVFAVLCTRYRFFPTPPPSGIPLYYRHADAPARDAKLGQGDKVQMEMATVEQGEFRREGI